MSKLYPLSNKLIDHLPGVVERTESHDPNDVESSDLLWVAGAESSDLCDGEYIAVSPLTADLWSASRQSADKVGGHPTIWDVTGTESEVLRKVRDQIGSEF